MGKLHLINVNTTELSIQETTTIPFERVSDFLQHM